MVELHGPLSLSVSAEDRLKAEIAPWFGCSESDKGCVGGASGNCHSLNIGSSDYKGGLPWTHLI